MNKKTTDFLNKQIKLKRDENVQNCETLRLDYTYNLHNKSDKWIDNLLQNKKEYTTVVDNHEYFNSKQFLFQTKHKHTFILGKRMVGKSYSTYEHIVKTLFDIIEKTRLLETLLEQNNIDVETNFYISFWLENTFRNQNLIQTLNEYIELKIEHCKFYFEIINTNILTLAIEIDLGSKTFKRRGRIIFAELYYLTQPILARNKQHKKILYVIFDEFEKTFSKSLLDLDKNALSPTTLFNNFLDIQNSFNRNENIRYLYFGNITNLNSPIWQFLEIDDFNFTVKVTTNNILIFNIISLFNSKVENGEFSDLTTKGIDEGELFNLELKIDKINTVCYNNVDDIEKAFILLTDNHILYFQNNICNVKLINLENMEQLNYLLEREFKVNDILKSSEIFHNHLLNLCNLELQKMHYPIYSNFSNMEYITQALGQNKIDELKKNAKDFTNVTMSEQIKEVKKIKCYTLGLFEIKNSVKIQDKMTFIKKLKMNNYIFDNLTSYMVFQKL